MTKYIIAFLVIVVGMMTYQINRLEKDAAKQSETIGALEQSNAQLVEALGDSEGTIRALQKDIELTNMVTAKAVQDKARFIKQSNTLKAELERLRNENEYIKSYSDTVKPEPVYWMLLELQNSDKDRASEGNATGIVTN